MTRKTSSITILIDIGLVLLVIFTRVYSASQFLHKWDSVQYALALSDYDITRHQPHPPGYPGYIGLGWLIDHVAHDANIALISVGIIFAAMLAVVMHHLGRALIGPRGGLVAGLLAAINPLLWYFSSIALAYISGVAVATLAVWISMTAGDRTRWIGPVIAGLSGVVWHPIVAILIAPVCIWAYLREINEPDTEADPLYRLNWSRLANFIPLFFIPMIIGYIPVIQDTGGIGAYLAEIQSESGKHFLRFYEWTRNPLDEFLATTGSLAELFEKGLGIGRWLLLILLIPITGEIGCRPKRVVGLLPLMIVGFAALHWGNDPIVCVAGILAFSITVFYLIPTPMTTSGWTRRRMLAWWLAPGLLLFVILYVNYVGILIFFLPGLILMEAWAIERAAVFMALQTIRDGPRKIKVENGEGDTEAEGETEPGGVKGPDVKVERFVAWLLIALMIMHEFGVFGKPDSQESWRGIMARDFYIESVMTAVERVSIPQEDLLILGGLDDYRHWTYYFPNAQTIWTKYLLYNPVREYRGILVSTNRHQDKVLPTIQPIESGDVDGDVLTASFDLTEVKALIIFPDEMDQFVGGGRIIPLFAEGEVDPDPICFLMESEGATNIVFTEGTWWLE